MAVLQEFFNKINKCSLFAKRFGGSGLGKKGTPFLLFLNASSVSQQICLSVRTGNGNFPTLWWIQAAIFPLLDTQIRIHKKQL